MNNAKRLKIMKAAILLFSSEQENYVKENVLKLKKIFDKIIISFCDHKLNGERDEEKVGEIIKNKGLQDLGKGVEIIEYEMNFESRRSMEYWKNMGYFIGLCELYDACDDNGIIALIPYSSSLDDKLIEEKIKNFENSSKTFEKIENYQMGSINDDLYANHNDSIVLIKKKQIDLDEILKNIEEERKTFEIFLSDEVTS